MHNIRFWPVLAFACLVAVGTPELFAQSDRPLKRIVGVGEVQSLSFYKKKGTASAPFGARIVTVTLELADSVEQFQANDWELFANRKAFPAIALGDTQQGYCPTQNADFVVGRRGHDFEGYCQPLYSQVAMRESNLTAAFLVPSSIPLESLVLFYQFLDGTVPLGSCLPASPTDLGGLCHSAGTARLAGGLTVNALLTKVLEAGEDWSKNVTIELEIHNEGSANLDVTHSMFRLPLPTDKDEVAPVLWQVAFPLLEMEGLRLRSVPVYAGARQRIRIEFQQIDKKVPLEGSRLGFFRRVSFPLKPPS
ncbi:MAG TPA: hypothetical protein VNN18_04950 [Candidatus Xenobia bacterium]|nr:hypothetical protein [Candidatus Xenobia bacterium]